MTNLIQIGLSLALLGLVTWLFGLWSTLFESKTTAGILFGCLGLAFAFIYDRRQASKRQSSSATKELEQ